MKSHFNKLAYAFLIAMSVVAGSRMGMANEQESPQLKRANPEMSLPVGADCTVEFARGTIEVTRTGKILNVNREWLVLQVKPAQQGVPILAKVPYNSRLFKSENQPLLKSKVWIPRDSILLVTFDEN